MKIQVLPNNKGQAENPFDGNYSPEQYDDFERDNPPLDLTEKDDRVGLVVDGELVDRVKIPIASDWSVLRPEAVEDFKLQFPSAQYDKAWQLTPVKEGEENYSNSFDGSGWKAVAASPAVDEKQPCVIMKGGEILNSLLFNDVPIARNYIKMQNSNRRFKENKPNEFTCTRYGTMFKIIILKNS